MNISLNQLNETKNQLFSFLPNKSLEINGQDESKCKVDAISNEKFSSLLRPIEDLRKQITELPSVDSVYKIKENCKCDFWSERRDISKKSICKELIQKKASNSYIQKVVDFILSQADTLRSYIVTEPEIASPGLLALEIQARKYFNKYGIIIRVAQTSTDLVEILSKLNEQIKTPTYVGIITGYRVTGNYDSGHVAPLLCYFNGSQDPKTNECLILDSADQIDKKSLSQQLMDVFNDSNIHDTSVIRQADGESCRTGAIVLLRNALLSLKYHQNTSGFSEILKKLKVENNKIYTLPPEWIYTEQICDIPPDDKTLVIRGAFSKHEQKRAQLETVASHRKRYTKEVEKLNTVAVRDFGVDNAKQFESVQCPENIKQLCINESVARIQFKNKQTINNYLVQKGLKNLSNLKNDMNLINP